ncbi:ABC transporter ATP-binding protein [Effusibacillus lacus]|uniref:Macrolide ABC transporter ATP-binding protein n=2 Tax=Effusibacillus lacus TaxID=1348429 RepID=A0A292YQ16_9BACL|nr:ABC transporter ATP-binding protein [Effusibacillus lacus]TCS76482.1 putative ABC transport system ATP-binding protein [Effusibacillus lacus]GAX90494.1 macrolide ABC transporter ATP-binding protein [Effusibacillus lacus]
MIQLADIRKTFQTGQGIVQALENINLSIGEGVFLTVMGASGSGKSTLLSLIGMLCSPTEGLMTVKGRDTGRMSDCQKTLWRREKIGFVFQFPSLVNTLNVRENVVLPKLFSGKITQADWDRADFLLDGVGLGEKLHNRSYELSGGEQRRVALARALINDPEMLLADEPTGALDEDTAIRIMQILRDINRQGKTVVMVTHDGKLAEWGNRLIRLKNGRIEYDSG